MTSEVSDEHSVTRPGLGVLSPETDATRRPPEETWDDSSLRMDTESDRTTSGLSSTGNTLLTVADRLEEKLCGASDGAELEEDRSSSEDDDDEAVALRENSPRDCATQQPLPVSRSQYHSIQQLSRPSPNLVADHRLFGVERRPAFPLNSRELPRHPVSNQAGVPSGRYITETGKSRDVSDAQSRATESEIRWNDDAFARSDADDEDLTCVEDYDERQTDAELSDTDRHDRKSTTTAETIRTWSSEVRQNGGGNTAVENELEAKRARVEHIVRSMRTPPGDVHQSLMTIASQTGELHQQQLIDGRRQRRKQFAPLQHQRDRYGPPHGKRSYVDDDDDEDEDGLERDMDEESSWSSRMDSSERDTLRFGLQRVQDRLVDMHNKYIKYLQDEDDVVVDVGNDVSADDPIKRLRHDADDAVIGADFNRNEIVRAGSESDDAAPNDGGPGPAGSGNIEALARMLKAEISDSVGSMVDEIVRSFVARRLKVTGGGTWRHGEPADGGQPSTTSPTSSPDTHQLPRADIEAASSGVAPPPLTPVRASTAVDLRFPVPPPAPPVAVGVAAGNAEAMERAAAAAAKLVVDGYSLQSAAAMAAYLDNAFLLHGKTAFEMPPSHATSSSTSAAVTHRLFTPTPYYPAQHAAFHSRILKVNIQRSPFVDYKNECVTIIIGHLRLATRVSRANIGHILAKNNTFYIFRGWRGGATGRALDLRAINRSWVQFLYSGQKLRNNLGQVVHTDVTSVTMQYNLVPA